MVLGLLMPHSKVTEGGETFVLPSEAGQHTMGKTPLKPQVTGRFRRRLSWTLGHCRISVHVPGAPEAVVQESPSS